MGTKSEKFTISSNGFNDVIDITQKINNQISLLQVKEGIVSISILSATASIMVFKQEPGLVNDFIKIIDNLAPLNRLYQHDNIWHDGNAYAHLKSAFLNKTLTLPVIDNKLALEDWTQILLIDFDNKPSNIQIAMVAVF